MNLPTEKTITLPIIRVSTDPPPLRKITERPTWKFNVTHIEALDVLSREASPLYATVRQQINYKINGYKAQDQKKDKYNEDEFVTYDDVVNILQSAQLICYYCSNPAKLLYDDSRDQSQWTLERIDNKLGHLKDNVELACLRCNLRRRVMYSKNYLKTKAITAQEIVKLDY